MTQISQEKTGYIFSLWWLFLSLVTWAETIVCTILLNLIAFIFVLPISAIVDKGSRRLIHMISYWWGNLLLIIIPVWSIKVEGAENIDPNKHYVIVANHQSLVDILALLSSVKLHFKYMAKQELFSIPFIGWHMKLAKYVPILRGQKESAKMALDNVRSLLRQKISVAFFPEGTRSTDGEIQSFKSGAFKMAIDENVEILPVIIEGTGTAVPKHSVIVRKTSRFLVRIGKPVHPSDCGDGSVDNVKDVIRNQMIQELKSIRTS